MKTLTLIIMVVLFAVNINSFAEESSTKKLRLHKIRTRKVDTKYEERADKNNDGKVSRKENRTTRNNYLEKNSEVSKKWEEKADKNNDGTINAKEFRKARNNQEKNAYLKNRSKVNEKWEKRADKNNDDKVNKKELKKAIKNKIATNK
jgi:EF hand